MANTDKMVGTTADGLVVIRSGHQARKLGLHDPFAEWFVAEEGYRLVQMARDVDAVYEEFNLARYLYTSSRMTKLAGQYEQMVILGAGFDCRALWLNGLNDGRVRVYEVDSRANIDLKMERLLHHGVVVPEWNRHIACDLREDRVKLLLKDEGLDLGKPVLLLAEGLFFYLPADITLQILDPKWLNLVKGSLMIFDCWSASRVKGLNESVAERIGMELFQQFPFIVDPENLREALCRLGYARACVIPLSVIAEASYRCAVEDAFPLSWWVVEATV